MTDYPADSGNFGDGHECQKQPAAMPEPTGGAQPSAGDRETAFRIAWTLQFEPPIDKRPAAVIERALAKARLEGEASGIDGAADLCRDMAAQHIALGPEHDLDGRASKALGGVETILRHRAAIRARK